LVPSKKSITVVEHFGDPGIHLIGIFLLFILPARAMHLSLPQTRDRIKAYHQPFCRSMQPTPNHPPISKMGTALL
jgi:hypothetical protein